jgi:hypothetical protein
VVRPRSARDCPYALKILRTRGSDSEYFLVSKNRRRIAKDSENCPFWAKI